MHALGLIMALAVAGEGSLLRNGAFQDDWLTLLPELKNHHWCYTSEVYARRDYNPDGWEMSGRWRWLDADRPRGLRRLVMSAPSRAQQRVNWVTVHASGKLSGWPDAGGFPNPVAVRSKNPQALVPDLKLRVLLSGKGVPRGAGTVTVAWSGASPADGPPPASHLASASAPIPEGDFTDRTVEVTLPAAKWLESARKDPAFGKDGALLPMAALVEVAFTGKSEGTVEVHEAALHADGLDTPNLLPNGGFEAAGSDGKPVGWSRPRKYRYFPPGAFYIFNTWHNASSDNRGSARLDQAVRHHGRSSLRMTVPTGDEAYVVSGPVKLEQKEPRLLEVRAWVKTHQLAMLQIDAEDQDGKRLDCYNFVHKRPLSMGTDDWRQIRQVFRPSAPLKSVRVKLGARGMNGYTLGGTASQPQQNSAGVVWWDEVSLHEPESSAAELRARGITAHESAPRGPLPHLARLDLGEMLLGENEVTAELINPGAEGEFAVRLSWPGRDRRPVATKPVRVGGKPVPVRLPYTLETPGRAYEEVVARLEVVRIQEGREEVVSATEYPVATWTVPMQLRLGALYLRPGQKQFVRVNLGLSHAERASLKAVRLEVLRRGSGKVLSSVDLPATPKALLDQRERIPDGLRDDFRGLILTDLDVSSLPLQPFHDPQRYWVVRATAIGTKRPWSVTSPPFCRLGHDAPQPAITEVKVNEDGDFLINGKPWMPWGVTYGHNPVYDGPASSEKRHDLANLKPWGVYDLHGGSLADRSLWDANCLRHVEGPFYTREQLEAMWKKGLYASTVFLRPPTEKAPWPEEHLKYLRSAPMVAAVSRGPEEAFAYFLPMTARQLDEVKAQADHLRRVTGKPVMVGHGGYWNRLELERAPFFDIYDPETEPLYPAPVHTDLRPLVAGKKQVIWLRPQMYESVPYERWRYHTYVELMRGARGWQVAHGPGDASTFRGLHAEMACLKPWIYSKEKPPEVRIEPPMEHLTRRAGGKTLVIAATTHGLSFGPWRWSAEEKPEAGRARVTAEPRLGPGGSGGGAASPLHRFVPHGIQYLPEARKWPEGTKLVTWVKLDEKEAPKSLMALVKADGRWTHAGAWGKVDLTPLRKDNQRAFLFLRAFYRHARGFLGWEDRASPESLAFIPEKAAALGEMPRSGKWLKLEVTLDRLGAAGKLLDGVGFLQDGGRAWWARTALVTPDGKETVVFGDHEDRPSPESLRKVRIHVPGLKKGTKVRVLFEDREILADEGSFVDDFTGEDLYQRHGGERFGYGNAPVALHVYEVP
jgi:hypothetical protein